MAFSICSRALSNRWCRISVLKGVGSQYMALGLSVLQCVQSLGVRGVGLSVFGVEALGVGGVGSFSVRV